MSSTASSEPARLKGELADLARAQIAELFARHAITDPRHAKRLVRERFSQEELDVYRKAMAVLDGLGVLG